MKSAYELAMERLGKNAPVKILTPAQKAELADLDSLFKSRIAEKELAFKAALAKAQASGESRKTDELLRHFQNDKQKLETERESRKRQVRGE